MAKIDNVRRACEDIGTHLTMEKRLRGADNGDAMKALALIHTEAIKPEAEPTLLWQQLEEFRKNFQIPEKVAASYRIKE